MSTLTKTKIILSHFQRLSTIERFIKGRLGWTEGVRVSALDAMAAVDYVEPLLGNARRGDAFLIHLMLPHFPFAYDQSCRLRADPDAWLNNSDPAARPQRNTPESRAARYRLYLDQVVCTQHVIDRMLDALVRAGVYDDATIVIHGDHGSRIVSWHPRAPFLASLEPRDFIDSFSTLFAAKLPGVPSGVDRRVLPLDTLLAAVVRDRTVPPPDFGVDPFVFVSVGAGRFERKTLPSFSDGRVAEARAP